jgi:hypothetical protein
MKKQYMKPTTTIVEMKQMQIICASESLPLYEDEYTTEQQW